jgi:hypothetical protein
MIPSPVPAAANKVLSTSNCRRIRLADAPSARRTESSCRRAVDRASNRFVKFVAATKRTAATAAINVQSAGLNISTRYENPERAETKSSFMARKCLSSTARSFGGFTSSNNGWDIDAIRRRA